MNGELRVPPLLGMQKLKRYLLVVFLLFDEILILGGSIFLLSLFGIFVPLDLLIVLVIFVGVLSYLMYRWLAPLERPPAMGSETLVGQEGEVYTPLTPYGLVKVKGEIWRAYSSAGSIGARETVIVTKVDGLTLQVKRK